MSPSSQTTGPEQQPEALTDERLAEIEQREAAATPGPWGTYECGGGGRIDIAADMEHTGYGYRCRREIARFDEEPIDNDRSHEHWDEDDDWSQVHHDAEFVAHSRSDVPALVVEVKRLAARVAELEKAAVEGRAALADLVADHDDPGSAALGALWMLSNATLWLDATPDEAAEVLARHDATVLEKAADALEESDHLLAADEVRDMAAKAGAR